MRISLLHTIKANEAVFDGVADRLGLDPIELRHETQPELRQAVEKDGMTDALKAEINHCLARLASEADAVIVTCATLGPAVNGGDAFQVPVVRADTALVQAATRAGGSIVVLCAAESAIEANRRLFEAYAARSGAKVAVRHLSAVWELFKQGDVQACLKETAQATDTAYREGADVVAFAHPWMAPAAELTDGGRPRPFDSAHAAFKAALEQLAGRGR